MGRLCSDTAISRITAAVSGNILGRDVSQLKLLDPGHTCLSTRAQRIDSCDVLLLSECLAALAYAPVLSYSGSHRPPEQRPLSNKIIFQYLVEIYTSPLAPAARFYPGEMSVPEPKGGQIRENDRSEKRGPRKDTRRIDVRARYLTRPPSGEAGGARELSLWEILTVYNLKRGW